MDNKLVTKNFRLVPSDSGFLDRKIGFKGEIFYDSSNNSLRIFDGASQGGVGLAKSNLANVSNADFLAKATDANVGGAGVNSFNTILVTGQSSITATSPNESITLVGLNGILLTTNSSTDTITVSAQINSFGTISVAGQSDIEAAQFDDTLTLIAGNNISITTDDSNNTITIDSSGGGGNTTVSVGATLPSSPSNGNLWLNTNNGGLYVYINDGDSNQWIQPAFGTPDLTNYATKAYVDSAIEFFEFYVAADDSTQHRINTGNVVQFIGAGGVTTSSDADGNITITGGGTTGNVTFATTTIDTTDSSAITFTPAVSFQSDITVENDLFASAVDTPRITSSSTVTISSSGIILEGLTTLYKSTEVIINISGATGTIVHDYQSGSLFFHSNIAANFTANFTNIPTTSDRSISIALILDQGASAYIPNAVQINGGSETIKWSGGSEPSGTNNYVDIVNFTLIRSGGGWTVLGSLSTYN